MSEGREAQVAGAPAAICETRAGTEARPLRRARLFSWRPSLAGILHLVAIWVIVVVVWCLANDRVSPGSWHVPLSYGGDSLQMLTWFRAASELDYVPFVSRTNSRLGAPYRANWDDYPMYEAVVTFLIGMVARWTDLATASNLGVLASFLASATSFYVCCRLLRWRREWAAVGALLFAFTWYHSARGLGHLLLAYDYTVPAAVMGVWLLSAGKRLRMGDRVFWLGAATALLLGMGNPYNLSLWLQFLCLEWGCAFCSGAARVIWRWGRSLWRSPLLAFWRPTRIPSATGWCMGRTRWPSGGSTDSSSSTRSSRSSCSCPRGSIAWPG